MVSTTTEHAGSVSFTIPPSTFAPLNSTGFTASGFSNVLWSWTFADRRIRPLTFFAPSPSCSWISCATRRSTFTREMCVMLFLSFEAETDTAFMVSLPA